MHHDDNTAFVLCTHRMYRNTKIEFCCAHSKWYLFPRWLCCTTYLIIGQFAINKIELRHFHVFFGSRISLLSFHSFYRSFFFGEFISFFCVENNVSEKKHLLSHGIPTIFVVCDHHFASNSVIMLITPYCVSYSLVRAFALTT